MIGMLMMFSAIPTALMAQQHIERAFQSLRNSNSQQETQARHSVNKNPDTELVEGMSDIYDFEISAPTAKSRQLITDVERAFVQDEEAAYNISKGTHGGENNYTMLAVGNSNKGGVAIGLIPNSRYVYACFLDPEDSLRRYRYAYGFEWAEEDGKIKGRLAKTYATTLKYRESQHSMQTNVFTFSKSMPVEEQEQLSSERWLTKFNYYKNLFLKKPEGAASSAFVMQIYKISKDAKSLDDAEKNMVCTEIDRIKKKTKDEFIQQLFDMSIERLKK